MRLAAVFACAVCCLFSQSPPVINPGGVVNAASYSTPISPGSLFSIFGNGMASGATGGFPLPLPTSAIGTSVNINGIPCPLLYVSPTLVNAQVPVDASVGSATLTVSYGGASASAGVTLIPASPGFFYNVVKGLSFALGQHNDGSLVTSDHPAIPGETVGFFGTGIGPVSPSPGSGVAAGFAPGLAVTTSLHSATINGVDAPLSFLGLSPGSVGLMQLNVGVPASTPGGNVPLVLTVDGLASQPYLQIPVAASAALNYTFDFASTSVSPEELISYGANSPTPPGAQNLNTATPDPSLQFGQSGTRNADGSWTFLNQQNPTFLYLGTALFYTWQVMTDTSFLNKPGTYTGIPAKITATCGTEAGSACIGAISFGFIKVGTASGTVTITIR